MTTKLTLALDELIVKKAKNYAKTQKLSLSKMVEFYFSSLALDVGSNNEAANMPFITSKLTGMIKVKKAKKDKEILTDALTDKYL